MKSTSHFGMVTHLNETQSNGRAMHSPNTEMKYVNDIVCIHFVTTISLLDDLKGEKKKKKKYPKPNRTFCK